MGTSGIERVPVREKEPLHPGRATLQLCSILNTGLHALCELAFLCLLVCLGSGFPIHRTVTFLQTYASRTDMLICGTPKCVLRVFVSVFHFWLSERERERERERESERERAYRRSFLLLWNFLASWIGGVMVDGTKFFQFSES